jgi:hypothetical protein
MLLIGEVEFRYTIGAIKENVCSSCYTTRKKIGCDASQEKNRLSGFQGRQDEPIVLMHNFAGRLKLFHGPGNADAVGSG